MTTLFRVLIFLALGVLAGCYPPTTDHPVGTSVGLKQDPLLVGLWHAKGKGDDRGTWFHFIPMLDGTITAIMVQDGDKPDGDWSVVTMTTALVGANHIMNARMTFADGKADTEDLAHGNIPLLYRVDGRGRIELRLMNEDATKAAIKAGAIAGSVEPGQYGDAKITADPKALDAFMGSKEGAALFTESFMLLSKME